MRLIVVQVAQAGEVRVVHQQGQQEQQILEEEVVEVLLLEVLEEKELLY